MSWTFEKSEHEEFARHALVAVVGQLSFHPILKLDAAVPEYQEHIRTTYPKYSRGKHRDYRFSNEGDFRSVFEQDQHVFRDRDGDWKVTLRSDSINLESSAHESHEVFQSRFDEVVDALRVFGKVEPTRFGLRYINLVRKEQVGQDLGCRDLSWQDVIRSDFFPSDGLVDTSNTRFFSEVNSSMSDGRLVLRYGLIGETDREEIFRLDFDRFTESVENTAACADLIDDFAADIFSLFMKAAGPKLLEWMRSQEIASQDPEN